MPSTMITADDQAWLNGRLIPANAAAVPVWDLGVVAGAAVTEMARTYRHDPFRLNQHLRRLLNSCAELQFDVPYTARELQAGAEAIVRHNCAGIAEEHDLGIVAFVTAGANRTYLGTDVDRGPTVCIHTFPLPFSLWREAVTSGVRLRVPPRRQISAATLPVHLKIRNRLHWWLADQEAAALEPGSRALLLNVDGLVTETSSGCFYAVVDGVIVTAAEDVLNSLTRCVVTELAEAEGIMLRQTSLTRKELAVAQEAFTSSTPAGLLPVRTVDGRPVGRDFPGPVYQRLQAAWTRLAGVDTCAQIMHQAAATGT